MNYIKHLDGFYLRLAGDSRLTPFHISLYLALFRFWNKNRFRNPFPVSREELMFYSRIGSVNTYTRCIKQLHQWGYIIYAPSNCPHIGSKVSCTSFDKATGNTGSKANDKADGQTGETSYINNTNSNKRNKQSTPKKNQNGEGKKVNGFSPYHVRGDKDYSEPL